MIKTPPESINDVSPLIHAIDPRLDRQESEWLFEGGGQRVRYEDFTTIDWIYDFAKDRNRVQMLRKKASWLRQVFDASQAWIIVTAIGILTGLIAAFIVVTEEWLFDLRTGYCKTSWYLNKKFCCSMDEFDDSCPDWHTWRFNSLFYIGLATFFAFLAAVFVSEIAKYAAGSGIPEVKTILSGFIMRAFLGGKTLLIKLTCLPLVTASGMAVGKEGPLVHVACCVGNIFPRLFSKYANNEAKKREILSAAVAAGVSSAFGAPIGGVLFSLEEVSYYFPYKTMLRSFFSAMMAAVTIQVLNPFRSGKLVMFQVTYEKSWHAFELFFFVLLGVLGGLFGAAFIRLNLALVNLRKWSWLKLHPILEASIIAFFTAFICNFNVYLRMNTEKLVSILLNDCSDHSENFERLCDPTSYSTTLGLLLLASIVKVILTVITFGIRVPCGIFIPSICVGACVGRLLGILVDLLHSTFPNSSFFSACGFDSDCIAVGPYALLGAAAFLSGVTRMTVSLVVMMFEVTGALQYILPIMITVMVSKFVGDAFGKESIYDGLIRLNGYPFLDSKEEYAKPLNAGHVMTGVSDLILLTSNGHTVLTLEKLLEETAYKGFPIVSSLKDMQLIGYINRNELKYALNQARNLLGVVDDTPCAFILRASSPLQNGTIDLSPWVDQTPITLVAKYPMEMTIELFKKMGLRYVLITRNGLLLGLITKKDVLKHLGRVSLHSVFDQDIMVNRIVG